MREGTSTDQSHSPWQNRVHASSALPVGDSPLPTDNRLDDSGVDDAEEECSSVQSTQYIGQLPLGASITPSFVQLQQDSGDVYITSTLLVQLALIHITNAGCALGSLYHLSSAVDTHEGDC